MDDTDRADLPLDAARPDDARPDDGHRRGVVGHASTAPAMPGPMGPAVTTEAVGDPDATSERSAAEGGAAAGAVAGVAVGGPIGMAVGAALGGVAGAASGPAEPVARPGERVDPRADREAAYEAPSTVSPMGTPRLTTDPLTEEHAVDIPVIDALTGHGEAAAERPSGRTAASGGSRPTLREGVEGPADH
jgi:hypothetical protein